MTNQVKTAISFTPFTDGLGPTTDKVKGVPLFGNTPLIQDLIKGDREGINDIHGRGYGEDAETHNFRDEGGEFKNEVSLQKMDKDRATGKSENSKWVAEMVDGSKYEFPDEDTAKTESRIIGKPIRRIFQKKAANTDLIAHLAEGCVEVFSSTTDGKSGVGAAFCVADGIFMTCAHVVMPYEIGQYDDVQGFKGRSKSLAVARGELRATASIVSVDLDRDIVVLRADLPSNVLKITKSNSHKVGESVVVIGSPKGFENNVSEGIIGSLGREVFFHDDAPLHVFTDAKILPGNSGGPMISLEDGTVIGMVEIIVGEGSIYGLNAAIETEFFDRALQGTGVVVQNQ